jgi:hypothetical protein
MQAEELKNYRVQERFFRCVQVGKLVYFLGIQKKKKEQ